MRYSYTKLYTLAFGNSELIVKAFNKLYEKDEAYMCLTGDDFIINPKVIYHNTFRLSYQQQAEYLGMLALRSYSHYTLHGYTDLSMARVPSWITADVVNNNPLITIHETNLIFIKETQL